MMLRWFLLLGLLFATSCQTRVQRTQLERGRASFQRLCAGCHGPTGKGNVRVGFSVPPRDLTDPSFQANTSDEQIMMTLKQGKGQMPAFGALLPESDLQELLTYIRSLPAPR